MIPLESKEANSFLQELETPAIKFLPPLDFGVHVQHEIALPAGQQLGKVSAAGSLSFQVCFKGPRFHLLDQQ